MRMDTGLSVQLPHYTEQHRQPSPLPAISLFMLPSMFTLSVNIGLIILRAADMRGKQAERTPFYSPSLCYSVWVSLAHLFTRSNKQGPGWGSPPL